MEITAILQFSLLVIDCKNFIQGDSSLILLQVVKYISIIRHISLREKKHAIPFRDRNILFSP